MVQFVVIGDPHFQKSNVPEMKEFHVKSIKWIRTVKPAAIICLGDVLHRHGDSNYLPLQMATDYFDELRTIAPTYIIMGNHDRPHNKDFLSRDHFFGAFKYWTNLTIVDRGLYITIDSIEVVMVPYVPPGKFEEAYNLIAQGREVSLVFAHQEFKGAVLNTCGHKHLTQICSDQGDIWPEDRPPVISGHIHKRQHLNNVIYVGTPLQHDFGDLDTDKGVALLTVGAQIEIEYFNLDLPRKISLTIKLADLPNIKINSGDQVRIVIEYTDSGELKQIEDSADYKRLKKVAKIATKRLKSNLPRPVNSKRNFLDLVLADLNDKADVEYLKALIAKS